MIELGAYGLMFLVSVGTLWFLLARFVPRAGQLMALYWLHDLRDDVFDATLEYPEARETDLYRDVDRYLAFLIRTVRDRPYEHSAFWLAQIVKQDRVPTAEGSARGERFLAEIRTVYAVSTTSYAVVRVLERAMENSRHAMVLRVAFGHWLFFIPLICMVLVMSLGKFTGLAVQAGIKTTQTIADGLTHVVDGSMSPPATGTRRLVAREMMRASFS